MENDIHGAASEAPAGSTPRIKTEHFEFTGTGGEYFRIWIVNLLLSIITLGIYSAWAKVRRLRYFYGSTQLAGSSFEYHGDPINILKGRLIAFALLLPYSFASQISPLLGVVFALLFLIALPFIVVRSRRFQTRMSSWRNIRFNFVGRYGSAAWIYIGMAFLIPLTLGLIIPYIMFARQRFLLGEAKMGATPVQFNATPGRYYLTYLFAGLVLVGTFIVAGIVIAGVFGGGISDVFSAKSEMRDNAGAGILVGCIVVGGYLMAIAIVQAGLTNAAYGELGIGLHEVNCDVSPFQLAGIYFTNTLFMVLTVGLYTPWATIRLARYHLECMRVDVAGDLNQFAQEQLEKTSATGEEIGDLFDMDFGL
ncbi:MAG TPA: YjgN family protein [Steroidobacteraceae bacterium]|nr:YjgN family protein [Steroidobacteraceae bacterium]